MCSMSKQQQQQKPNIQITMTICLLNNAGTASSFLPKEKTDGYYIEQTEVESDVWRQQSPSVHTNLTYCFSA